VLTAEAQEELTKLVSTTARVEFGVAEMEVASVMPMSLLVFDYLSVDPAFKKSE